MGLQTAVQQGTCLQRIQGRQEDFDIMTMTLCQNTHGAWNPSGGSESGLVYRGYEADK